MIGPGAPFRIAEKWLPVAEYLILRALVLANGLEE